MDLDEDEIVKRFGCAECGHSFAMECEDEEMTPRFCPFCAAPVYVRDVEEEDEIDIDDEDWPTGY